MNKIKTLRSLLCLTLAAALPAALRADDAAQSATRENPQIESGCADVAAAYPFIDAEANTIRMNGADWSELRSSYARALGEGHDLFTVLHLGDSHIQADFATAQLRTRLAAACGSAGRGLLIPFRAAGTNEPVDYSISVAPADYASSRLLRQPWSTDMPFTGIGIAPSAGEFTVSISCRTPFDRLRFFFEGTVPDVRSVIAADGEPVVFAYSETESPALLLPEAVTAVDISFCGSGCTLGGVEVASSSAGALVHGLGNNGATFESYNTLGNFAGSASTLTPDLYIISLGTNEAFGATGEEAMRASVDALVTAIRRADPHAALLLTTPAECFRRARGRKGRRGPLTVNAKVARMRRVIADYAAANGVPLYDWYAVAGGAGSAARRKAAGLLGADGIHDTAAGYTLSGNLLADALMRALAPAE